MSSQLLNESHAIPDDLVNLIIRHALGIATAHMVMRAPGYCENPIGDGKYQHGLQAERSKGCETSI